MTLACRALMALLGLLTLVAHAPLTLGGKVASERPIVIAHRGASGYLPEHTLPAKALAHAMGADFIEQDVVLTADGVPIVLHDIHLDSTTNVAQLFPERARADGRYYAIDFALEEIRRLHAHERRASPGGEAAFPNRFPLQAGLSGIPTLREEIALISGLNHSRKRQAGFYIELKAPRFHRDAGLNIARSVLEVLKDEGLANARERVYLQCFDPETLRELRHELRTPLPLIQLVADNSWQETPGVDYDALRTPEGLASIAGYADGIGPWIMQIYLGRTAGGEAKLSDLVPRAHEAGLLVHPYTVRDDQLPAGVASLQAMLDILVGEARVDGFFTDFPDTAAAYLAANPLFTE